MYLEIGTVLNGRYRIEEKLGVGGMAVVYRGEDTRLGRSVTIKVLKEEYIHDEASLERFHTEAQAVARLSHPNIVNVYDVCQDGDIHYIVMEYIEGDTLKVLIDEHAPFSNRLVLNVALSIAQALSCAHRNHIVHRDIKPQNILVSVDGTVKVTDFGIARGAAGTTMSTATNVLGSVHYFSPEQARGGYIDEKSDIYSLGVTMFEMATGRVPFDGDSTVAIALKHLNEELPSIEQMNPSVSHSVAGIIRKAMRKKADERYANINTMISDLRRALAEEQGMAPPAEEEATLATAAPMPEEARGEEPVRVAKPRPVRPKVQPEPFEDEEDDTPEERRRGRLVIVAAVVTALAIIAVIVVVFSKVMGDRSPLAGVLGPKTVTVPVLTEMTLDEAEARAKELGLELVVESEVYADGVAEGQVVSQSIAADTQVDEGSKINVTVSKGLEPFVMPTLTDKGEDYAVDELAQLGVRPLIVYEYSEDIPAGVVVRQEPAAGTEVTAESNVTLTVSKGEELKNVTVPDVRNMTEAEARKALEDAGLTVGRVSQVASNTVDEGKVITQTVSAGSSVMAKTTVGLAVSSGKKAETPATPATEQPANQSVESPGNTGDSGNTGNTDNAGTNPVPEAPAAKSKTVTVSPPMGSEMGETVYVQLIQVNEDGTSSIVMDGNHSQSDFPLTVTLTGTGNASLQVFLDGVYQWSETVSFN